VIHVGLNLIFLVPGETGGMEVYARELTAALAAHPGLRLTAFVNRETELEEDGPWGGRVAVIRVPVNARNRMEWVRGEQQLLPSMAERAGCRIVHSLASTAPLHGDFLRVTTIHDLIFRIYPAAHFGFRAVGMRAIVPLGAKRSHRVIADSRSTRDDLERLYGVPRERMDVVPLAGRFDDLVPPLPEPEVRELLALGDRQIALSVSAKRPHKNLLRLLEALALIEPAERPVLVIPGYATPHEAELRARAASLRIEDDVRFPAWLPTPALEGLYRAAAVFVFPSLYEGFGLPVLEAMARGVPVAVSDRSSLPEVAGDAALYFDPERPDAIAAAIRRLLRDRDEAERLRAAGALRAARFTWEATAAGTIAAYERALGHPLELAA